MDWRPDGLEDRKGGFDIAGFDGDRGMYCTTKLLNLREV
jgi:hypothetical protein